MALSDEDGLNLWRMIGRIRRAMPRNVDVMAVCDALEESLRDVTEPAPSHMTAPNVTDCPVCVERRRADAARVARHRAKRRK